MFFTGQGQTVATVTEAPSQTFHGQIGQTGKFSCWECNVWKAGYGVLCIDPRVREQCFVCMTVNTTIYMGYYKDTPRRKNRGINNISVFLSAQNRKIVINLLIVT